MTTLSLLAYIDPMSGAIVLQLIIAAIAGAAAFFRRSIWACASLAFRRKPAPTDASAATEK